MIRYRFRINLPAQTVVLLAACTQGTGEPQASPTPLGSWFFAEVTNVDDTLSGGPSSNECQLADVPMVVDSLRYGDAWHAVLGVGGTIQCEVDGAWGPEAPYTTRREMWVYTTGDSVRLGYPDLSRWDYVGVFTDSDVMEGRASWSGRTGTWRAVRAPQA
jgi:hypothetical protein